MKNRTLMQVNTTDALAGVLGLMANFFAFLLGLVEIANLIDGALVAFITLLITFYGSMFLRWLHGNKTKKKRKQT